MPNSDTPFGLKPIRHQNGSAWNGQVGYYKIPASDGTATFKGDAVKLFGTATADGIPQVIQCAAGDTLAIGAIVDFEPDPTNLGSVYRAASTLRGCYVCDSMDVIYEMQEDGEGATLALADVGENCDIVVGSGNTNTGKSGMEIDSSTHGTGTAQLRIMRLVPRPGNEAASQWSKWEVMLNEHAYKSNTGT
jgi:hypothetical protein